MNHDDPLVPPLEAIEARLTENQRERNLLRALQRLAHRADRWRVERAVHEAALARLPERPLLARALGDAAFADGLLRAAVPDRPNPVTPLRELLKTGYVLAAADPSSVTLEMPQI